MCTVILIIYLNTVIILNKIYLITHRYDRKFTQLCIASIRYWYPQAEIFLIKNYNRGSFSTALIEKIFNVKIIDAKDKDLGIYYGKFEAVFKKERERFFTLDNDCVFAGKVLEYADAFQSDFVVDEEVQLPENVVKLYFNPLKAKELIPDFPKNVFTFNMGQWMGTSGILSRNDIKEVLAWDEEDKPAMLYPKDFPMYDQSVFNYLLNKTANSGSFTLKRVPLMYYPKEVKHDTDLMQQIKDKHVQHPRVIHWAGLKKKSYKDMNLSEILFFYNDYLYSKMNFLERIINRLIILFLEAEQYIKLVIKTKF